MDEEQIKEIFLKYYSDCNYEKLLAAIVLAHHHSGYDIEWKLLEKAVGIKEKMLAEGTWKTA